MTYIPTCHDISEQSIRFATKHCYSDPQRRDALYCYLCLPAWQREEIAKDFPAEDETPALATDTPFEVATAYAKRAIEKYGALGVKSIIRGSSLAAEVRKLKAEADKAGVRGFAADKPKVIDAAADAWQLVNSDMAATGIRWVARLLEDDQLSSIAGSLGVSLRDWVEWSEVGIEAKALGIATEAMAQRKALHIFRQMHGMAGEPDRLWTEVFKQLERAGVLNPTVSPPMMAPVHDCEGTQQ